MKGLCLLVALHLAGVVPAVAGAVVLGRQDRTRDVGGGELQGRYSGGWAEEQVLLQGIGGSGATESWDAPQYEHVTSSSFSEYQLRLVQPSLCDPSVKQYSGYLDISDGKHLFFWFFEARRNPENAPLTLWLNGGPGCSSATGLLFELGPCSIADEGHNVTLNEFSWNRHSNMLFLDQPVNVGYSYSDDGTEVDTTPVAAEHVYAFLQLFFKRFPQYAQMPFHVAAESYGGTYAPHIASTIHNHNTKLAASSPAPTDTTHINLASVILANGITDPYIQMPSSVDYACNGPYPIFDDPDGPECRSMRSKVPNCQRLIGLCYDFDSPFTCAPAQSFCFRELFDPIMQLGINLYDVRKKCDREKDGDLCYVELEWTGTWMDRPATKRALGVQPGLAFRMCNEDVGRAFAAQGDGMRNSAALLPELVDAGVRLLVYAGNADFGCNFMGNEAWVTRLPNRYHDEFKAAPPQNWTLLTSGRVAGEVRTAGGDQYTAGNVTFVQVYEAGHMAPHDQPEALLDLFTRWIMDVPLVYADAVPSLEI